MVTMDLQVIQLAPGFLVKDLNKGICLLPTHNVKRELVLKSYQLVIIHLFIPH